MSKIYNNAGPLRTAAQSLRLRLTRTVTHALGTNWDETAGKCAGMMKTNKGEIAVQKRQHCLASIRERKSERLSLELD
jgi:hypothetical protein